MSSNMLKEKCDMYTQVISYIAMIHNIDKYILVMFYKQLTNLIYKNNAKKIVMQLNNSVGCKSNITG